MVTEARRPTAKIVETLQWVAERLGPRSLQAVANKHEIMGVVGRALRGRPKCRNKETQEIVIKKFKEGDDDECVRKTTMRIKMSATCGRRTSCS